MVHWDVYQCLVLENIHILLQDYIAPHTTQDSIQGPNTAQNCHQFQFDTDNTSLYYHWTVLRT